MNNDFCFNTFSLKELIVPAKWIENIVLIMLHYSGDASLAIVERRYKTLFKERQNHTTQMSVLIFQENQYRFSSLHILIASQISCARANCFLDNNCHNPVFLFRAQQIYADEFKSIVNESNGLMCIEIRCKYSHCFIDPQRVFRFTTDEEKKKTTLILCKNKQFND